MSNPWPTVRQLTLESASDLVGKDVGGTSDPYAVLRLVGRIYLVL